MDPGRAQAGSWATRIGLVATKVPFELGLVVVQVCSGEAVICELSVRVCAFVYRKRCNCCLNEEKVVWVQTFRHNEICVA